MIDSAESYEAVDKNRKSWTENQDQILSKLTKKFGTKRWTDISKAMSEMYQIEGKSSKQCRERWVNHLNPSLNKKKWSTDQQRIIFDAHKQYGNKWKKIALLLDNRSDNAIKNQFYSILRKGLRRVNKLLGDRKSTQMVKNIRTSVLSKLWKIEQEKKQKLNAQEQDYGFSNFMNSSINQSNISELLFQFSLMKSSNVSQRLLTEDIKDKFYEIVQILLQLSSKEKNQKQAKITENKSRKASIALSNGSKGSIEIEAIQPEHQEQKENNHDNFANTSTLYEVSGQKFSNQAEQKQQLLYQRPMLLKKPVSYQSFNQNQEKSQNEFFPAIQINFQEDQSYNMSNQSKDAEMNFFNFNISPRFTNNFGNFLGKTPLFNSPQAFNVYNSGSTAHSLSAFTPTNSFMNKQSSSGCWQSNTQFDKIVEELRSNINCNTNSQSNMRSVIRINSSRQGSSKGSSLMSISSGSLTPCSNNE